MNILTNASQAIDGEGDIWIKLKEIRVGVEPWAQISIKDSGKGMPPDVVDKIFDPFYTTKGVGQGTGLGLSISYGIIRQHGGEIRVNSAVGKGTEFVITVPVKGPPARKKTPPSHRRNSRHHCRQDLSDLPVMYRENSSDNSTRRVSGRSHFETIFPIREGDPWRGRSRN